MATASGELRNDPEFWNWVKSVHGLLVVRDVLAEFIEKKFKSYQSDLQQDISKPVCGSCTSNNLTFKRGQNPWTLSTNCTVCQEWVDKVLAEHLKINGGPSLVNKKWSDLRYWSDSNRGSWEITKIFMPSGHNHKSAASSDCAGLIGVLDSCALVSDWSKQGMRNKINVIRNTLMHAGELTVTEKNFQDYIKKLKDFISQLKNPEYDPNAYLTRLDQLKCEANPVEKLEHELQALKEQIENLRRDIENEEDEEEKNTLVQSFKVTLEFVAKHKDLSDPLHDCIKNIVAVLMKHENRVTNIELDIEKIWKVLNDLELSKEHTSTRTEIYRKTTEEKITITKAHLGAGDISVLVDLPSSSNRSDELSPIPQKKRRNVKSSSDDYRDWDNAKVCIWLKQQGFNDAIISAFRIAEITGKMLQDLTKQEINHDICNGIAFGLRREVIRAIELLRCPPRDLGVDNVNIRSERPRPFGSDVTGTTIYRQARFFPFRNVLCGDPLKRFQKYIVIPPDISVKLYFQQTSVDFACAMMNERCNGTLYVGVEPDGKIIGVPSTVDYLQWLLEGTNSGFDSVNEQKVFKCMKLHSVPVISENSDLCVVEIDVEPFSDICGKDVFFSRIPGDLSSDVNRLMRIKDGDVYQISGKDSIGFYETLMKHVQHRKSQEEKQKQRTRSCDFAYTLKLQLCKGESSLEGDIFPILVTSKLSRCDDEKMKKSFQFMKDLPWKVVFDFDSSGNLYYYLDEIENQVYRLLTVENFGQSMTPDQRNIPHRPWIFANGFESVDQKAYTVREWKLHRREGFKKAVNWLKMEIPTGRAVVVFLLFSEDYEVMLEAADELAMEFTDHWFTLAVDLDMIDDWQKAFLNEFLVEDQIELQQRTIIGTSWEQINDTMYDLLETRTDNSRKLPTSNGGLVKLEEKKVNDWTDVDILDGGKFVVDEDPDVVDELEKELEEQFYRGGEVEWLNFQFNGHVLERDCYQALRRCTEQQLESNADHDDKVQYVHFYHEPGAGGTTTAKHVLWGLRKEYRCAIVKKISDNTCDQITELYSYNDPFPKPVLLLFDNCDRESIGILRVSLEERARDILRSEDNPHRKICVMLLCLRVNSAPKKFDGSICLKHDLSQTEQLWFRKKYEEIKMKFKNSGVDPKHLISFNIMKENFNMEFIAKTVKEILSDSSMGENEKRLLTYVSLLNTYDLSFRALPVSAFDRIMGANDHRWELYKSPAIRILLCSVTNNKQKNGQSIRIINNKLSQTIFDILIQQKCYEIGNADKYSTSLGKVVSEFLESDIFQDMTYPDQSVKELMIVVCDLVKKRLKNPQTGHPESKFAPLVEKLWKGPREDISDAAKIMEKMYDVSSDVFVGQQLARLYIEAKNWEKAKYIATELTVKRENNSYLWDTLGCVYREQIKEVLGELSSGAYSPSQVLKVVDLALEAIKVFQKEQEISEYENTIYPNNSGYFQELGVVVSLLDSLAQTTGLNTAKFLHRVLSREIDMPDCVTVVFGEDRVKSILHIQKDAVRSLCKLEDENLQLRDNMRDKYLKGSSPREFGSEKNLIKIKESLQYYFGEECDEVPETLTGDGACNYRRRRLFRLAGSTFRAVFELRQIERAESILLTMREMVLENSKIDFNDTFDLKIHLSVNLTLCVLDDFYKNKMSVEMMAELAKSLYDKRDERAGLEAYLFAVMLNFPENNNASKRPIPAEVFPRILKQWKEAYYMKYPRQKEEKGPSAKRETTIFFLANGIGMGRFAVEAAKRRQVSDVTYWRLPEILKKLERWTGFLMNDGEVKITISQGGNKLSLFIQTSRPIEKGSWLNKKVYFVIGFTWAGPRAFDVSLDDPTNVSDCEA